jgi:CheY-like chemotaxis protein
MDHRLILIIDESEHTRAMYGDYFRYHGHAVAEAADGMEGLRLFQELQPDLVVTELSEDPVWMWSIGQIRRSGEGSKPAMIACSTMIDSGCPFGPPGVDVDLAVAKPISPRALLLHAYQVLRSQGTEVPALSA